MFSQNVLKCGRCEVHSMCGHSLKDGVLIVGKASLAISLVMLLAAVACLVYTVESRNYNSDSVVAVNLIFGLVASCLSAYQIVIALLLLWQGIKAKGNIFLCSLWYISHVSLLTLYFLLFSSKALVCFVKSHHITAIITLFVGIAYQGTFIYFAVVVNSYLHSLNQERYL